MATSHFYPKDVIHAISVELTEEFFNKYFPKESKTIKWEQGVFAQYEAVDILERLEEKVKVEAITHLENVHFVYSLKSIKDAPVAKIHSIKDEAIPEKLRSEKCETIVMWISLHDDYIWKKLIAMSQIDSLQSHYWHKYKLITPRKRKLPLGYTPEGKESFATKMSTSLGILKQGLGKTVIVKDEKIGGYEQVVCLISTNPHSQIQIVDGEEKHIPVILPREIGFIYTPEDQSLAIHFPRSTKKQRDTLCSYFAEDLKGTVCGEELDAEIRYSLHQFSDPSFDLILDDDGHILNAKLLALGVRPIGAEDPGEELIVKVGSEADARRTYNNRIGNFTLPLDACEITYVKIHLELSKTHYGSASSQTLEIKKTSCNITSRNFRVRGILEKALRLWRVLPND